MSDRAVKKPDGPKQEETKKENGTSYAAHPEARSPPAGSRPGAFRPLTHFTHVPVGHIGGFGASVVPPAAFAGSAASILAPGKLATNPFATKTPHHHPVSGTPNTSDSEDERKDKSIISPSHFKFTHENTDHNSTSSPSIVLRPSALSAQAQNMGKGMKTGLGTAGKEKSSSPFLLKPATLQSPFSKTLDDMSHKNRVSEVPDNDTNCPEKDNDQKENQKENDSNYKPEKAVEGKEAETKDNDTKKSAEDTVRENVVSSTSSDLSVSSPEAKHNFVFGQNMGERIVNLGDSSSSSNTSVTSTNDSGVNSNSSISTSSIFGQNLAERVVDGAGAGEKPVSDKEKGRTLAESAKEYQAKHAQKEYDEVVVMTGEEEESNVLQANCKLYMFDHTTDNWIEKGRGLLRLNDKNENNVLQSRIVMRTQGSLKVILNTKIWCGMMIEHASPKSLRLTAQCDGMVKVFLIMANPKDTDHLFSAIDWRIQQLKVYEETHPKKEQTEEAPTKVSEKRPADDKEDSISPDSKRPRVERGEDIVDPSKRRDVVQDESNDSSAVEPETEVSYESSSSSPTVKSSSSD